jgi:transcriptional regulator PpsR
MDLSLSPKPFAALLHSGNLGALDASVAAKLLAAGGDVAMLIDRDGIICDVAISNDNLDFEGHETWVNKRWVDTVAIDSRIKVDQLLADAANDQPIRWRELNHNSIGGQGISLRYVALATGLNGRILAIGRDHRASALLQQRLLEAQQALERDYAQMRDTESRYRSLFKITTEAVLVIDGNSRKIVETNPSANALLGAEKSLVGRTFAQLFAGHSQDDATSLLSVAQASSHQSGAEVILLANGKSYRASASLFRQDRATHFLVRLAPDDQPVVAINKDHVPLFQAIDRLPDSFVVTNLDLEILMLNGAFLDLVRVPTTAQAKGQSLSQFLGRPGLDRNILFDNLAKHGVVHNFPTLAQTQFGDLEDVEVSAVSVPDGDLPCYGFSIRRVARRAPARDLEAAAPTVSLPRSPADMSQLVGRVSLKEIVRDTTDVIERLCIEAALELTGNNRASAAEILGVSRQSLYSKLHRFGIGNLDDEANSDVD